MRAGPQGKTTVAGVVNSYSVGVPTRTRWNPVAAV